MDTTTTTIINVAVIGTLGLLFWVARSGQPEIDVDAQTLVFRHSAWFRGFSLIATFVFPIGFTIVLLFSPKPEDPLSILVMNASFGLLGGVLLWESFRFRLAVSADGLDCHSPWRGRRFLAWAEVEDVSYSLINMWFIIRANDGRKFRVHLFVCGLNSFLEKCEDHLPFRRLENAKSGYDQVGRAFPDDPR
jgi:hypothetical protein